MRRAVERLPHRGFVAPREAEADVAGRRLVQLRRALRHRGAAVDHDGQRLIVDRHADRRRRSACARVSAITAATASPTWRTVPRASAQRGGSAIGLPSAVAMAHSGAIGPTLSAAMSAPVNTATTPGDAAACAVSMLTDTSVRVRRAHQHAMQFAGQRDVGDVAALAAKKLRILDAPDRRADAFARDFCARVYCSSSRSRSSRSNADRSETMNRLGVAVLRHVAREGPMRDREHVVLRPVERVLAHGGAARAGHHQADHVAGGALRPRRLPFGQPHRIAVERRHHRPAGRRIGVAHRVRAVGAGRQRRQQPPRRRAGIVILRRMRRRVLHIGAGQAGLGPQLLVALIDLPELVGLGIAGLEEIGVELANERNVGGVEPDDAVVAVVDMAVPAHRRRQDQIALVHVAAAAVDDGGGALGARGEADRREGVPVRPRAVAGIEHGEGRDQVRGRHRLAAERRVDQDQRAPLDVVDRHFARPRAR